MVRRKGEGGNCNTFNRPLHLVTGSVGRCQSTSSHGAPSLFCSAQSRPSSLLLRCFALWRNANLAGGFAGRFLVVVLVVWLVSRDDLP